MKDEEIKEMNITITDFFKWNSGQYSMKPQILPQFQIQYLSLIVTLGPPIKPHNHQLFQAYKQSLGDQKLEKVLSNSEVYF